MVKKLVGTVWLLSAVALVLLYVFPQSAINIAIGLTVVIVALSVGLGSVLYGKENTNDDDDGRWHTKDAKGSRD